MAAAASAALGKMLDACSRWDKEDSGRVSLSAYLLALRTAGLQAEGSDRERARELARAGGKAVRLPAAWISAGWSAGDDKHGDVHGSVRYSAVNQRVCSAWKHIFGSEIGQTARRCVLSFRLVCFMLRKLDRHALEEKCVQVAG